jgi:hypothetical protein
MSRQNCILLQNIFICSLYSQKYFYWGPEGQIIFELIYVHEVATNWRIISTAADGFSFDAAGGFRAATAGY